MTGHRHDKAISEVVGSVPMVAVIVIFVMPVSATVLSLAGSMQQIRVVGVVAVRTNGTHAAIT
jgi:flagellin-like protein